LNAMNFTRATAVSVMNWTSNVLERFQENEHLCLPPYEAVMIDDDGRNNVRNIHFRHGSWPKKTSCPTSNYFTFFRQRDTLNATCKYKCPMVGSCRQCNEPQDSVNCSGVSESSVAIPTCYQRAAHAGVVRDIANSDLLPSRDFRSDTPPWCSTRRKHGRLSRTVDPADVFMSNVANLSYIYNDFIL
jgi:hypothetical protein